MSCKVFGHSAAGRSKWNDGHYFAKCQDCGADILRTLSGPWKLPPKGLRVVWKPLQEGDIDWQAWEDSLLASEPRCTFSASGAKHLSA